MELWRELLISALQDESRGFDSINDGILGEILENECYKVLFRIKQAVEDDALSDEDCFTKIERIIEVLEKNHILCDRHDFG